MEEKIKELEMKIDSLYIALYYELMSSIEKLIDNKVTDTEELSYTLERCLCCIEDKRIANQFWKLINYVETFELGLGAHFRRCEEVITEGY